MAKGHLNRVLPTNHSHLECCYVPCFNFQPMIVCVCHKVSDRDIKRQVRDGCSSFEALQFETGAATCCGCCESCAREVFEQAQGQTTVERPIVMMGSLAAA